MLGRIQVFAQSLRWPTSDPKCHSNPDVDFPDIESSQLGYLRSFDDFTMTSIERRYYLLTSIRYLVRNAIEGSIVECGVWRGGSMMIAARELIALGDLDRALYLFDTFDGMPAPHQIDIDISGRSAFDRLREDEPDRMKSRVWAIATREDVEANMRSTDYPVRQVNYVQGRVEDTLPEQAPEKIALLRLDTDWHESTKHELVQLWPRLVRGGILIIDDYGFWQGARKAVDEFFETLPDAVMLHRIDDTCRAAVKIS